jgi:hypothetical protein
MNTVNKYRTFAREKELDDEIEAIEKSNQVPVEDELEPETPEEKTFKKRYGDLRSHLQKKEDDWNKEKADLLRQLQASTAKQIEFPKSEDEINDWLERFPDVGKIVQTIAMKTAAEAKKDIDDRLVAVEKRERESAEKAAYKQFIEAHSDFPEIQQTQEYQDWLEKQPRYIYDALYRNSLDALAAIRAVDLYKADTKKVTKPATREVAPSAQAVRPSRSEAPSTETSLKWTESKVQKLSSRDYDKFSDEIDEAAKNPAFYDISGAAR